MGYCRFCGKSAGMLRSMHRECESKRATGYREMVKLAAQAASRPDFDEAHLQQVLTTIAGHSFVNEAGVRAAIAEGWREAVTTSLSDGILTQDEENRLREFRDRLALETSPANVLAEEKMQEGSMDRITFIARQAALSGKDADTHLGTIGSAIQDSGLSAAEQRRLLIRAWEAAIHGAIEDGLLTLEEESSLVRYMEHFDLGQHDLNGNGAYSIMVEAIVLREVSEGIIPQRCNVVGLPINLQKSEQLVWAFNDVDYYELKTKRERRGTSHGVSIRVARGLYYSPRQFRSQSYEWDETVHAGTGVLAITNKHIYFHGGNKSFRIPYNKIVSFDQYSDGFGLMRDAQTAKPQSFRIGDGWFVYNLVTNLARL